MTGYDEIVQDTELEGAELLELFATPILRHLWPDSDTLNAQLRAVILSNMEESPGVVKTNRGGWQSEANLQTWQEDSVKTLLSRIQCMMRELVRRTVPNPDERHLEKWHIRAWANVNQKGHFNKSHHHIGPNSLWSGIYYVDVGQLGSDKSITGRTVFEDRSRVPKEIIRNPNPFERESILLPQNGLLVLFPASLYHSVEPYSGEGVRITIAFNLWHSGFTVPYYEGMEEPTWWSANFRGLTIIPRKIPEKFRAMTLIPEQILARKLPRSLRWTPWWSHFKTAIDHAFAQASALQAKKQLRAEETRRHY